MHIKDRLFYQMTDFFELLNGEERKIIKDKVPDGKKTTKHTLYN